jgi:transcriptional regulator with XRE-family HTH domain
MTQEQFAEAVGISVDFLSLIERGINAPSLRPRSSIARVLKASGSQIIRFQEIAPDSYESEPISEIFPCLSHTVAWLRERMGFATN